MSRTTGARTCPYAQIADPAGAPEFKVSEWDAETQTFTASRTVEISTPAVDGHLDPWHGLIWGAGYPGGADGSDLWQTERDVTAADLTKGWATPVVLGADINTAYEEQMPSATRDGDRLVFMSDRPGGRDGMDIV